MIDFEWDGDYVSVHDGHGSCILPLKDIRNQIEFEFTLQESHLPDGNDQPQIGDPWIRGRCLLCGWCSAPVWFQADNALFAVASLGITHGRCVHHLEGAHAL